MSSRNPNSYFRKLVVVGSFCGVLLVAGLLLLLLRQPNGTAEARLIADGTQPAGVSGALTVDSSAGGLRLCNKTDNRVGVAVGHKLSNVWTTEGWWNVNSGSCETLIGGPLVSRYYYVYALDYDQGGAWGGKAFMCTRDKMFTIAGIKDCVARGYERTGFFEVDTGEQRSWTVQLTEPGTTGTGGR